MLLYNSSSGDTSSSSVASSSSSHLSDAPVSSTKQPERQKRPPKAKLEGYTGVMDHKVNMHRLYIVRQIVFVCNFSNFSSFLHLKCLNILLISKLMHKCLCYKKATNAVKRKQRVKPVFFSVSSLLGKNQKLCNFQRQKMQKSDTGFYKRKILTHVNKNTELKLQLGFSNKDRWQCLGWGIRLFVSALVLCMEKEVGFEKFHALKTLWGIWVHSVYFDLLVISWANLSCSQRECWLLWHFYLTPTALNLYSAVFQVSQRDFSSM